MTSKLLQPETDHASGYFDVTGFATAALGERACVGRGFRPHIAEAGGDPGSGGEAVRGGGVLPLCLCHGQPRVGVAGTLGHGG